MLRLGLLTTYVIIHLLILCGGTEQTHCTSDSKLQGCPTTQPGETHQYSKYFAESERSLAHTIIDSVYETVEGMVRKLAGAPPVEKPVAKEDISDDIDVDAWIGEFQKEVVPSLAELKLQARKMAASLMKDMKKDVDDMALESLFGVEILNEEDVDSDVENSYEYPPLYRRKPGKVDDVTYVGAEEGKRLKVITRSINPPIFEVPDFISDKECDYIVNKSEKKGLIESRLFSTKEEAENNLNTGVERKSYSAYLAPYQNDIEHAFMEKIYRKISKLLNLPVEIIRWSEPLAIGRYTPGGYYHAHLDSTDPKNGLPCCFQTTCATKDGNKLASNRDCCRICRYATVLYYLSDVEEGGETAFPLADTTLSEMLKKDELGNWKNLTEFCHESSVIIKPKKGKAIFWYNHLLDKHGYLANVEKRSYHGGCDVIEGTKWIATNWITTPVYNKRFLPSNFRKYYE